MLARGITGNGFLYTGTIFYNASVLQSVSNGGTVNGNDTLNIQIRTLLSGYSTQTLQGFTLYSPMAFTNIVFTIHKRS